MDGNRVALPKIWVTSESHTGWHEFCLTYGVTRTGLVEALGLVMGDMAAGRMAPTRITIAIIERAKRIDDDHHRRG